MEKSAGKQDRINELEALLKQKTKALRDASENFRKQINDRIQAEKALRKSEEKYRRIFESIQDTYVETSLDGKILEISPSVEKIFQYRRTDLIGKDLDQFFASPSDRQLIVDAVLTDGSLSNREIELISKDGNTAYCLLNSTLVRDDQQRPSKVVSSLRNITESKKTAAALEQARTDLYQAQKMKALGTLVSGVAHEINNPTNLIMLNIHLFKGLWQDLLPLLTEEAVSNPERKFGGLPVKYLEENLLLLLNDTEMAVTRIAEIVKSLKEFYRRSSVSDMVRVDINAAVNNALKLTKTMLRKSGVELITDLAPALPEIEANLQSVEQILMNLIINAGEAVGTRGGQVEVKTRRDDEGRILVTVSDNGKGVSPDMFDNLFDPFVTDKQDSGGTGLGLSVTYSLVQAHAGRIRFRNRTSGGTEFLVSFPATARSDDPRILVVDDDEILVQLVSQALEHEKAYHVETAVNGVDACTRLGEFKPDVVILDVFMPEVDGVEVCRTIKTDPLFGDIDVIVVSGVPEHSKIEEIRRMGFTTVFGKPVPLAELLAAVRQKTGLPARPPDNQYA
ncbi:MAG: response regulator [Desulfobacterales bacterium]|nr:response regulator [Desulfobacterales bacterium]